MTEKPVPFTDDDLKRLKASNSWIQTEIDERQCDLILALLARLDASEALNVKTKEVVELLKRYEMPEFSMGKDWEETYVAWLKSAGKSGTNGEGGR